MKAKMEIDGLLNDFWKQELDEFIRLSYKNSYKNTHETKKYRFMTNFSIEDRHIYEKALMVTGVDMFIKDEAFAGIDHDIPLKSCNALWVNENIGDCSKFWNVHRSIKEFYE